MVTRCPPFLYEQKSLSSTTVPCLEQTSSSTSPTLQMDVSEIGVPLKHPKMIIFSRKSHGCWGNPPFLETPKWLYRMFFFKACVWGGWSCRSYICYIIHLCVLGVFQQLLGILGDGYPHLFPWKNHKKC